MSQNLGKLTYNMDETIGTIGRLVESLADVEIALGQLRQEMDIAVHRGEERLYFHEHHRQVRMLAELMHYLMRELVPASEKAHELHLSIFKAVRGEQTNDPTKTRAAV